MNIGDKDADGWTYVRFGDAAKAAQEGAHEVEGRCHGEVWLSRHGDGMVFYDHWQYRIREKARTITVTIPRPDSVFFALTDDNLRLRYKSPDDSYKTYDIIRAAMEQS